MVKFQKRNGKGNSTMTSTIRNKQLKRMMKQYPDWIEDNSDYLDAITNPYFMNRTAHQEFEEQLKSNHKNAGWRTIMNINYRYADLVYHGYMQLLSYNQKGWDYIDRALDGAWWEFKINHDGDIEAGTAFMLAHCYLLGYHNRTDYLGHFFYHFEKDDKAKEMLAFTDISRFIAQLWAKNHNLPLHQYGKFLNFEAEHSGYALLVRDLYAPDNSELQYAIQQALDFHIEQSAKETGWMSTAIAYYLFPVEILYFLKLREEKGLTTSLPKEHILWKAYEKIQPTYNYTGQLLIWDKALKLAFDKAVSQGFLQYQDWDFFYVKGN